MIAKYLYFIILLKDPDSKSHQYLFGNSMKTVFGRNTFEFFPECIFVLNGTTELGLSPILQIHTYSYVYMFMSKQMKGVVSTDVLPFSLTQVTSFLTDMHRPYGLTWTRGGFNALRN